MQTESYNHTALQKTAKVSRVIMHVSTMFQQLFPCWRCTLSGSYWVAAKTCSDEGSKVSNVKVFNLQRLKWKISIPPTASNIHACSYHSALECNCLRETADQGHPHCLNVSRRCLEALRCTRSVGSTVPAPDWPHTVLVPNIDPEAPRLSRGRHIQSLHLSPPRSRVKAHCVCMCAISAGETCTKWDKVDQIKYNFQLPETWKCFNHLLDWYVLIHNSHLCLQGTCFKIHNSRACRHLMCHVPSNCKGYHITAGQMDKLQITATGNHSSKQCKTTLKVEWR